MHCRFKEEWIIHFLVVLTQVQSISDDFFCLLNEYANMNMQASFIENKNIYVFWWNYIFTFLYVLGLYVYIYSVNHYHNEYSIYFIFDPLS